MGEPRTSPSERLARPWHWGLFAMALAGWLAGFSILLRWGTWIPFAFAGPTLAVLAVVTDARTRALLRPSFRGVVWGGAVGTAMALATWLAFGQVAPRWAAVYDATVQLYQRLNVHGFSPQARAGLIVLIASSEEILFRGALLSPGLRSSWMRGVALAAGYALATVPLGSGLLVACAFGCGLLWGALRVATRSLVAPIIAHGIWDMAILIVWPLAP